MRSSTKALLGVALVASALSFGAACAQDVNSAPNGYRVIDNWAQLPPAEELPAPEEAPIAPIEAASPPAALAEIAAVTMPTAAPFAPQVQAVIDRPLPAQPTARYQALAAIAALSDDEKIALFS